jgi:hypothetical protein
MFENTAIGQYITRVKALEGKHDEIFKIVLDNKTIKDLIIFLNTSRQLGSKNVDSLGNALTNRFSGRTTYSLFDKKGRGGQPYKLFDTGDFWKTWEVEIDKGFISIKSDPRKGEDNLFEMFGAEIEGLTDDSLKILIKEAYELYVKWFEKQVLLR